MQLTNRINEIRARHTLIDSRWGKISILDWLAREVEVINQRGGQAMIKRDHGMVWISVGNDDRKQRVLPR